MRWEIWCYGGQTKFAWLILNTNFHNWEFRCWLSLKALVTQTGNY